MSAKGWPATTLTGVAGILNGTCNYILSRMSATDEAMDIVLADAQRLGYAEADPTADVDGFDAAAKLVVLAGIAFRRHLKTAGRSRTFDPSAVSADFRYATRLGCTIRQVSRVQATHDGFHGFVGPALVPQGSSFGRNEGANNVVTVYGRYGGESSFSGAGAGGPATAVAVVSDLLALTQGGPRRRPRSGCRRPLSPRRRCPTTSGSSCKDRPGILASIAAALARQGINLDAVLQEPGYPKDRLPFVITVEPCDEAALHDGPGRNAEADWHAEPPLALPMLLGRGLA